MISGDTIAAISSAAGMAARMIVRMSGAQACSIASQLAGASLRSGAGGEAYRTTLQFQNLAVPAWVYQFRAPHSYTGEDLIEFHIPGNPLLARMLLDELLRLQARPAEPGEFTARAFFNGRIDLTAAEGVAATISAHSQQELTAARQLLSGELARRLRPLMDQLAEMVALVEVGIDFSEEDVSFIAAEEIQSRTDKIKRELQQLMSESARFERLSHEPSFVLVGRPNAGKSTLLNVLAGRPRAVVSPVAGTTRDALSAEVALDRGIVSVIDVAGLEEKSAEGEIDRQMQELAMRMVEEADFVILLREAGDERPMLALPRRPDLVVASKSDLPSAGAADGAIRLSARTGQNLDLLLRRMSDLAFGSTTAAAATLALNTRHLRALDDAMMSLSRVDAALGSSGAELIALELREALHALGEILGQLTPDDLLGRIFSTFCIGK
ncbi:MAG TPA: tRNA modification GTPase [Tepidisphaeraceae bacterium]|jgi:tRNA modification GTPase|nr:tRNA modification GTPase [Tepidisphaeraceae bacterium]